MSVKWLVLIFGILSNASASVLVKMAMMPPRKFPSLNDPIAALSNWPFWLGLALYGCAFLFYAGALARLPLNIAHPVLTAGAIATVALCSVLFFRESFHWTTGAGIVLVIIGVGLITARVS
ncbi:multidrug transporter [Pseudomonas veronii]|uniref:DMT family transporter n=1 Tax=Pseudomonas veronii TaxID=76761 RepID=UPI0014731C41|nr:SMR family transporter [Pseudomonas veronii]MDF3238297.1 SMR family transporter [Pseudomonas veronii]NMX38304.1 multidrug transporter [Pseudomonas veronii]